MVKSDVVLCMADLKNQKSEGYDQIPVCCLLDARKPLLKGYCYTPLYENAQT